VNLLSADLQRFAARRLVRGALAFALLLTLVIITVQTVRGHEYVQTIEEPRFEGVKPRLDNPQDVFQRPDVTFVPVKINHDTRVDVAANLSGVLVVAGILLVCTAFVLGASSVAADFGGSSLSTQLLYEPRRWLVHMSKALATGISCAALAVCVLCTIAAAMFIGSKVHGIAPDVDAQWWQERAREIGRGAAGAGIAGAMAYTIALVFRRTAVGAILFLLQVPLVGALETNTKLLGAITRSLPYYGLQVFVLGRDHLGEVQYRPGITTTAAAFVLAAVWLVGLVVAAGAIFGRAEVR
jgi:hypothetical protein